MPHKSVLSIFFTSIDQSKESILNQIESSTEIVTEGRYLISVFDAPADWDSRIPMEGLIISKTLGYVENRNEEWEFFGNGTIRCYKGKSNKLKKTLQWNIIKRVGDKPYKRKIELSSSFIKKNTVPVSDPVFTRDVANNVWNLNLDNITERIVARFSSLLTWQDEEFYLLEKNKLKEITNRKKLDLTGDLVGVPSKVPYIWNSGDTIF
jgi:hypothetical protein